MSDGQQQANKAKHPESQRLVPKKSGCFHGAVMKVHRCAHNTTPPPHWHTDRAIFMGVPTPQVPTENDTARQRLVPHATMIFFYVKIMGFVGAVYFWAGG